MICVRQMRKTPSLDRTYYKIDDLSIIVCVVFKKQSNNDKNYSLITLMHVCQVYFNIKEMLMPSWMIDDNLVSFSQIDIVTIIDLINGFSK